MSFFSQQNPSSGVLVGDPIIWTGREYMILHGQGDFRQTQETANVLIMANEKEMARKHLDISS